MRYQDKRDAGFPCWFLLGPTLLQIKEITGERSHLICCACRFRSKGEQGDGKLEQEETRHSPIES